ncbi:MAG: hypothetical protein QOH74_1689, partial [Gaiellales bacterium]|nr:hypothetical protein [Gaiellales bacterium]
NALGWSALLVPGAGVGVAVGLLLGATREGLVAGATLGAVSSGVLGLLLDRVRDRGSFTNLGVDEPETVAATLEAAGIAATPGEDQLEDGTASRYVTVQNKNLRRAAAVLGWPAR